MRIHTITFAALVLATGCAGSRVATPKRIPTPTLPPDPVITVAFAKSEAGTRSETHLVPQDDRFPDGRQRHETSVYKTSTSLYKAALNGQPISIGQLIILSNPNFDADVKAYADRTSGCRRGRPAFLYGLGGAAVGGVVTGVGAGIDNTPTLVVGVSMIGIGVAAMIYGGGVGAFTCGKTMGGRKELAADDYADVYEAEHEWVSKMAERFNAQHRR